MFQQLNPVRILLTLGLFALAIVACSDSDPSTPDATATPMSNATNTPEPQPTDVPDPTAVPTDVPQPEQSGAIDWEPQIIYSSPQPGEAVTLNGAITVRFDQPMDQASVEEAFQVVDSDSDDVPDGDFIWTRPDTVVFTPKGTFGRNKTYSVNINPTAKGVNGKQLNSEVSLQFETVGFLEVSQIIPSDGSGDVETDGAVTVMFNRPVVPLVSTAQQSDLPNPLTIEPPVEGSGEWVSTSIYRFTPSVEFDGAATYAVTVNAGLQDVTGGLLADDVRATFTTFSPQLVKIEPRNLERVAPEDEITLTFNMPMDVASTVRAIESRPSAPLNYVWQDGNRVLVISAENNWQLDENYTLTINDSALSANGAASLDEDTDVAFITLPFPGVAWHYPEDGQRLEGFDLLHTGGVDISFKSPMNLDTVEGAITIDPQPEEVKFNSWGPENAQLRFALDFDTRYTITISGDVEDIYGNKMGRDYEWSFTTGQAEPLVSFNLPQGIAHLNSSAANVAVNYRNIQSANVVLTQGDEAAIVDWLTDWYDPRDPGAGGAELVWQTDISSDLAVNETGSSVINLTDDANIQTGIYRLTATSPQVDPERSWSFNMGVVLVVADTNLTIKQTPETIHVWATDLNSGLPVAGRNLAIYGRNPQRGNMERLGEAVTDSDGLASIANPNSFVVENGVRYPSYGGDIVAISEAPGAAGFGVASSNWTGNINLWQRGINSNVQGEAEEALYMFTDRPLYRPGDTVNVRGFVRQTGYGRYGAPLSDEVSLMVRSPNWQTEPFFVTATLDDGGGFEFSYEIPDGADLGQYNVGVEDRPYEGQPWYSFTVAEFRKPEITVSAEPTQREGLLEEDVAFTISAEYLFGGPAPDLNVDWNVLATPYFQTGSGYSFAADSMLPSFPFEEAPMSGTSGSGTLGADGTLQVDIPREWLDSLETQSYRLSFEATVYDDSGLFVATSGESVRHSAETYIGISSQNYFNPVGDEITVDLLSTDWAQTPVGNANVEVVFYQRTWEYDSSQGGPYGSWTPVDAEVTRVSTTTNADGEGSASFTPTEGGNYYAEATVTDGGGRTQASGTILWVYAADADWRFDPRDREIELVADQDDYQIGDVAQIVIPSPFEGPLKAWLTIERGEVIEQRIIDINSASEVVEVPISAEHAPNIFVTVTLIKGVDGSDWPVADIRYGVIELNVDKSQLLLDISITPNADFYGPGETASYTIQATDYAGNGVETDLSVALIDLALLSLQSEQTQSITDTFYANQPLRSQLGAGLFQSGDVVIDDSEAAAPAEPMVARAMGGGGEDMAMMEVEESAMSADMAAVPQATSAAFDEGGDGAAAIEVRDDFKDTAFWRGRVTTDANGVATIEIPLPDNLTTWQMDVRGVSGAETLVGQTLNQVTVSKPLLIRPITPRFFTVGDVVSLGAIVNNNTGSDLVAEVSLSAPDLPYTESSAAESQTVTIPANDSQLVRWQVRVPDITETTMAFSVVSGEYSDASAPTVGNDPDNKLPVVRYNAEDIVGTSGVLDEAGRRVESVLLPPLLDEALGTVDVNLSPSLAAALIESLKSFEPIDYRYICASGISHQLLPNAATARAIRDLGLDEPTLLGELDSAIPQQVEALQEMQRSNGAWGWCNGNDNLHLTAFSLLALHRASEAGYAVDAGVIRAAQGYVRGNLPSDIRTNSDANGLAYFLYVLGVSGDGVSAELDALIDDHRGLLDPHGKALVILAYGDSDADNVSVMLNDLNNSVVLSATGAHWQDADEDYFNLNSDVRGTALVVNAMAVADADNPLAPNAVRWLMSARRAQRWHSDYESAWVIASLTDWMVVTGELSAEYGYTLRTNGNLVADDAFTRNNITTSEKVSLPLSELNIDEPNYFDFAKDADEGRLYYTAHVDAFVSAESVQAVDRGFSIQRAYYDADCDPESGECEPLTTVQSGQTVRVELTIIVPFNRTFVTVEDPIPSGTDAIDPNLNTSPRDATAGSERIFEEDASPYRWGYWGWWYFSQIQFRDEKIVFSADYLPAGTYQYTYHLQAVVPGDFQVMPTIAKQAFQPEVFGRGDGLLLTITE